MKVKRRQIKRGRVEMIPMIDTIVILLIFYMSFARFAEMERESRIKLPTARSGDEFRKTSNQIVVNMVSVDDVNVAGQPYKVGDLPNLLRRMKASNPQLDSLILRGNRDMTYKDLSAFMKVCAKCGIADVAFATMEK
jgi:biopolymer transport protein ExbD